MLVDEQKLLLITGISLLYRESLMPDRSENSKELTKRVIQEIVPPATIVGRSIESEILYGLRSVLSEMTENDYSHSYSLDALLMTLRTHCAGDMSFYDNIERMISRTLDEKENKLAVIDLQRKIANYFRNKDIKNLLAKASIEWDQKDKIPNVKQWISELESQIGSFATTNDEKDPAVNRVVDFGDPSSVANVYSSVAEMEDETSILKCGWQGINRMTDGGFRPGEQWIFCAMEHNWKTGFSMSIFRQIAQYNTPKAVRDPSKTPALVRFSFEDSAESNMQFFFKSIYENETGLFAEESGFTPEQMTEYVLERTNKWGWSIFFFDVDPGQWTYKNICNEILRLEARGYEVRLCMLDYLLKIPTTGCVQGPAGVDIRNLYERVKAFMAARKITMITPHQLSADTKNKVREGTSNFVKEMVGGGYYAGTKQLGQVIDAELFLNIEVDNKGDAYLTIQRGKHRKIRQTPIEHLYAVLKFIKKGIIPDDLEKTDSTRMKVGGDTLGQMADSAFAEFMG